MAATLSLQDLRTRRLVQLSTGEQRMILLARALIKNPRCSSSTNPARASMKNRRRTFVR